MLWNQLSHQAKMAESLCTFKNYIRLQLRKLSLPSFRILSAVVDISLI